MVNDDSHAKIIALVDDDSLRRQIERIGADFGAQILWRLEEGGVVKFVADIRPLLVLVDLRTTSSEWRGIVRKLKRSPATRRLTVIGFAYDLDDNLRESARVVMVDEVFDARDAPQGGILTTLAARIDAYARRSDAEIQSDIAADCEKPLPALAKMGIEAFNAREFYEAHELLEFAWVDEAGAVRNVYRSILQVGVAYYHIQRGNYWAAVKMFLRAIQWLAPLPERCHRIDIARFREDTQAARQALESLGPERVAEFDMTLFKPVIFDPAFALAPTEHDLARARGEKD